MRRKIFKNLIIAALLFSVLSLGSIALAQDFGTNAVANGLNNSLANSDPREMAGRIINILLGILGVLVVGLITYAGYLWMTAQGEEEKIETAKKHLKNGVIGLAIILASWGIATFIISQLGGAMNGGGSGCLDGETQSCYCGGYMTCSQGSWGACVGSGTNCGGVDQTYCSDDLNPNICSPNQQKCNPQSDFCDDDCICKPKGNLGDPCDADLNNSTCEADNNRCSEYLVCNPDTCTCFGTPVITGLSPTGGFCREDRNKSCLTDSECATTCDKDTANGAPDNFITIFGKNFGTYSTSTSKVVFEGAANPRDGRQPVELNPNCVNSWRDDQIVIAVPSGASTGPIKVINKDNLEDLTNDSQGPRLADFEANNIARPGLCYLDPNRGTLSSEVNYQGINLYSGDAYFGNYQSNVKGLDSNFNVPTGLAGTSTTPNIRSGDSGSFVINSINGHQEKSNFLKFVKESEPDEGPYIISFSPTKAAPGQYVTITGHGFGGARGGNHVYFGNTEVSYDFPDVCLNSVWKDNQIIVKSPAGLPNGNHLVRITLGTTTIDTEKINPKYLEGDVNLPLKTSLCKIDPSRGPVATPVAVYGEYFGPVNSDALLQFSREKNIIGPIQKDGTADKVEATVPNGSISGPVRVIKNSEYGNELNFAIGECLIDSDCGTQICCPQNTYKKGRCVDTMAECFIDVPTSVFEWSFNTGYGNQTTTNFYSCAGLAKAMGSCQTGAGCPNVPGTCSPYPGGNEKVVGTCDYSCEDVKTRDGNTAYLYSYEASLDKCVKRSYVCDLATTFNYSYGGKNYQLPQTCNQSGRWEITFAGTCPTGWTRGTNNRCEGPSCSECGAATSCELVGNEGWCVSPKLCNSDASCKYNVSSNSGECILLEKAACNCCCEIGQDARDCCAPLKCAGTCGADLTNDGAGLGRCSGCGQVGSTTAEHDAACNCTGHSGQYCDINAAHPEGICTDCSDLSTKQNCNDHSAACCLDANRTSDPNDDACRGGDGTLITNDPLNINYGYCAYYNCQSASSTPPGNPALCASSSPFKLAYYSSITKCDAGCGANQGTDYCSLFSGNQGACLAESTCCFDEATSNCLGGPRIVGGLKEGYCAYYNCRIDQPKLCDFNATTTGQFTSTSTCVTSCANSQGGAGLSCANLTATSSCDTSICTLPGFGCFTDVGNLGAFPDCGACCCQPGQNPDTCATPLTPNLHCQADRGNCSGAGRGLCCGCTKDSDCGYPATVGCGSDTCCEARPTIVDTAPAHLATNVCRNAAIKVNFSQLMDITSFDANVLLLEERDYGNGVCPAGTFITDSNSVQELLAQKNKNILERLISRLSYSVRNLFSRFSGQALADLPNPNKLYCAIPGTVSSEATINTNSLVFSPRKLLAAATNYYLIVKGDEELNSQTGVISLKNIGFNGDGYFDPSTSTYAEGETINFNQRAYKNSQIIKFTTLSDQGINAGVCTISRVGVDPGSYLFKTTTNDLNENDSDAQNPTFDTKADKDKALAAWAYSGNGQMIQPVTGYFWDWDFKVADPSIAAVGSVNNLPNNQAFVSAQNGVTDSETKLTASIKMDRFLGAGCNNSANCSCSGANCSNNCCNVYTEGDDLKKDTPLFVFICNNPWPPVSPIGTWNPWSDNCVGSIGGPCTDYNYKFYYCRDAGNGTTLDDLPAIISQPVIRGQSTDTRICSADKKPCSNLGALCGDDKNGDSQPDGVCVWNILKESYFFREAIPQSGQISAATDLQTSGAVKVEWQSLANPGGSFKIYYLKSGKGAMLTKEVAASTCTPTSNIYVCNTTIEGLTNGVPYVFKVSVVSANKTESQLSSEKSATPTDKTPPSVPFNLRAEFTSSSTLSFAWGPIGFDPQSSDALFYRLYHGLNTNQYGESFDSANRVASISFEKSQFTPGNNYFALSAVDDYGNESAKSAEIIVNIPSN